jgi:hypothetical protein
MSIYLFLGYFTHVDNKWYRKSTYRKIKLCEIHKSFRNLFYSNLLHNVTHIACNSTCINISYLENTILIVTISYTCARWNALNAETQSSPLPTGYPLDLHCKTAVGNVLNRQDLCCNQANTLNDPWTTEQPVRDIVLLTFWILRLNNTRKLDFTPSTQLC